MEGARARHEATQRLLKNALRANRTRVLARLRGCALRAPFTPRSRTTPPLRALTWLAAMPRTRSANPRCNTGLPRFPSGQTRGDMTECADVGSVVWFARQSPGVRAERAAAWEQTCHDPRPCRLLLVGASPPERPSTRPGWWFLSSAWRSGRSSSTSPSESSFSLGPQHSRLCRPDSTRSRRQ
jgi:hypothetical protein